MKEVILTSSALILAIALLRRLLRGRIDPRVQYALWLLAAARLLIPGTLFSAPVSVTGAAAEIERAIQVRAPSPSETVGVLVPEGVYPVTNIPGSVPTAPEAPVEAERDWPDLVWKAGMAAMGGAMVLSNLSFYIRLRRRRQRLESGCGPLRVYAVEGLASPCLFGVLRPAVYLTPRSLEADHLDYVLAHEYTHFRHGDHLWALLRSVCLVVHWYNPLVWWAALLCRRDCELACDAGAIARVGEDRRLDYGQTLLRLVSAGRGSLLATATTMTAGKRSMAERVAFIAKRPRMLKITLAAVVLVMCAVAAVTFGGAAEKAEVPPEDPAQSDGSGTDLPVPAGQAPAITEAEAEALYARAREAWDWFWMSTLPLTEETFDGEAGTLDRVEGFDSLEALRGHLLTLFTPELADYLLQLYGVPMEEHDGHLYRMAADLPSDIYAGKETVTAFVMSPGEAEEYGYSVHIFAQTEVLDEDLETVLGTKRHDFYAVWNGENFVFTNFGPWDDVQPNLFYNAQEISAQLSSGADTREWLPLMAYMDWNALGAVGGDELCNAVREALYVLIQDHGAELSMAEYLYILSATEGLDGALSEEFSYMVYLMHAANAVQFAYVVLEELPQAQQDVVVDFFRYEYRYEMFFNQGEYPNIKDKPSREEAIAHLESDLTALYITPQFAILTEPGETFQLQLVNAYGIYAATYESADTDVAAVDQNGTVTAVGTGKTTVTLHFEGDGGVRDFVCTVTCWWEEKADAPEVPEETAAAAPDEPDVDEYEMMLLQEEMMSFGRSVGPSMSFATAAPDMELAYDGTEEGLESAVLWQLEEHARGIYADDFFDCIQLEGEPVLSEDGRVTVSYYIVCAATTTLSNGEPYTVDCRSQLLTTVYTLTT